MEITQLTCPSCGAAVDMGAKKCAYCRSPLYIQTFQSVENMSLVELNKHTMAYQQALAKDPENMECSKSIAYCYLKTRLYDKAIPAFEKAIENNFSDADLYMYTAICLLKGKRPFVTVKTVIDQAIEYLNSAIMIENKGIYHYLLGYIKYDYYEQKHLNITPGFLDELIVAHQIGLTVADKNNLFTLLGVPMPNGF